MKALKIFSIVAFFMAITSFSFGQSTKTETFKVLGNCGMCKAKIEKAAKAAGATYALWSPDTKEIKVTYSSSSTNTAKIQKSIADVGYDNAGSKANSEAYNKLHGCCKYDRTNVETKKCGSDHAKCEMKDGKCTDMAACKDKGCCDANAVCTGNKKEKCCKGDKAEKGCCKKS